MSLYQTLSNRPIVTNALTLVVLFGALAFIAHDVRGQRTAGGEAGEIFFSIDDGQSYFAGAITHLPPFDFNGREAVRAYVYAGKNDLPFVAYLERYTPEARKKMQQLDPGGRVPIDREFTMAEGVEIKRPGDADWVKRASEAGEAILQVKIPGDDTVYPRLLLPGD